MSDEKQIPGEHNSEQRAEASTDVNRRAFFAKLGLGSLGIAAAGTAAFSYQFLSPNVLYEPAPIVNAGKPENYAVGDVTIDVNNGIYVIRAQQGFFALSAVCTHLGCLTAWKPELGIIACPCHGSKFYVLDPKKTPGEKIEGPAPRPLPWLEVKLGDDGDLMVDRSKQIKPGNFLAV